MLSGIIIGWFLGVGSIIGFLKWLASDDQHDIEQNFPHMTKEEWSKKAMH